MSNQAQLLWTRSAVCVHPTKHSADNEKGYLSVMRFEGAVILAWSPEKELGDEREQYAAAEADATVRSFVSFPQSRGMQFSLPVSNLFSLQIREPSLGWWYGSVVFYTRSETTLPALFFHDDENESDRKRRREMSNVETAEWGGSLFLKYLQTLASVVPSKFEKGLYLVNPDLTDERAFAVVNGGDVKSSTNGSTESAVEKASWQDVKFGLFQKLAQVTKLSRMMFDKTPAPVRALLNIPEVEQLGQDFDSARVFLAEWALGIAEEQEEMHRKAVDVDLVENESHLDGEDFALISKSVAERRNPVTLSEWTSFFDDEGRLQITVGEVKDRIFHGGLEPPARPEAWLFLLGVYPWDSSKVERQSIRANLESEYYRLKRKWWEDLERQQENSYWRDQKSRIEKDVLRTDRNLEIFASSQIPHPDPESKLAESGANPHLEQLRDILISYNEANVNLGYVQGMSDLLSPLYVVLQNDSLAFSAFCAFMKRMERNFMRSQEGMRDQLQTLGHLTAFMLPSLHAHLHKADSSHFFFFFRMILVWFKREFEWDEVMRLWEVLWTDYYSSQFHLFVALAILDLNKHAIMTDLTQFDEILKYINELGLKMDLNAVLTRAEQLFIRFKAAVSMADHQRLKNKDAPEISEDLRQLLSKKIVEQRESERPPGAGGG